MKTKFQERCERDKLNVTFKDGVLIDPIPKVRYKGRNRTEMEYIDMAISKFSYSSVVEAMFNTNITLTL